MAYQADILINVKGFQDLTRIQKALEGTSRKIDEVNNAATRLGAPVRNIERFSRQLDLAGRALQKVAIGSPQEQRAISNYVTALNNVSVATKRQNKLIQEEIAGRNAVTNAIRANVEKNIQESKVTRRVRQETAELNAELVKRARLERQLASRGLMQLSTGKVVKGTDAGFGVQGPALPPGGVRKGGGGGGGSRLGGAISGSIIGGAFPLLFGQGAGAATGGAIGGLVGGLAGPGGSFAGSLLGTLLGDIASKGKAVQDLADDMGLAAGQTKQLAAAFQAAGADADKFGAAVQTIRGIGFADEEQVEVIKLVSKLTEDYGGKIDKVAAAYGNFAAKGKVGIADINKFTAQGIPILDELEKKYGKNRDQILALAKDGKITAQDLSDALVEIANRSDEVTKRTKSSWEQTWENLKQGASTSVNAIAIVVGSLVGVSTGVTGNILQLFSSLYVNLINGAVNAAAGIADALAATANNIAAFYKANPLVIPALRDAAVGGLESFKTGAKGTANRLRGLTKTASMGAIKGPTIPGQLPPSGDGGGKSAADKAAEDAAREAARVAELVRDRQLATLELQRQAIFSQKIAEAEMAKDPILTRQLQGQQEIMQLGIKTAAALEKEKNSTAQLAIAREFQAKKALALLGIELDIAKIKQQQTEQYNTIISDLDTELALKYAITEQERTQLRIAAEMRKLRLSDPSLTEPQLMQIQQGKERLAAPKTGAELIAERSGALEDELKALTDSGNQAITIATGIGDAFANSFKGIISGSMSAREALAGFFQSVADQFLDMAAQIIAKWIEMTILNTVLQLFPGGNLAGSLGAAGGGFGGTNAFSSFDAGGGLAFGGGLNLLPGRANGGPVSSGQMYMVGERGPELFVPGRSGTIVANDKMGGGTTNVVVNVDAKGSSVEGNEQGANQLGRVISAAVQSELIKQQRPGGLLAR